MRAQRRPGERPLRAHRRVRRLRVVVAAFGCRAGPGGLVPLLRVHRGVRDAHGPLRLSSVPPYGYRAARAYTWARIPPQPRGPEQGLLLRTGGGRAGILGWPAVRDGLLGRGAGRSVFHGPV